MQQSTRPRIRCARRPPSARATQGLGDLWCPALARSHQRIRGGSARAATAACRVARPRRGSSTPADVRRRAHPASPRARPSAWRSTRAPSGRAGELGRDETASWVRIGGPFLAPHPRGRYHSPMRRFPLACAAVVMGCAALTDLDGLAEGPTEDAGASPVDAEEAYPRTSALDGSSDGAAFVDRDAAVDDARAPGTCGPAGCRCSGGGSCTRTCVGGGCEMSCSGGTSCAFGCSEGGCRVRCESGARCEIECAAGGCRVVGVGATTSLVCPGNGCTMDCSVGKSCAMKGCTASCYATCTGGSTCTNDCNAPTCQ